MAVSDPQEFDWESLPPPTRLWPASALWPDEGRDLTPWVIDNLGLLGERLGLTLDYVGREWAAGAFRADIVATDSDGRTVIIENQFGPSDHVHFAQIVIYALELKADVVVWLVADERNWLIPSALRPEHRRALAQLNEVFAGQIAFYGVELSVTSQALAAGEPEEKPVPSLRVVVRPKNG